LTTNPPALQLYTLREQLPNGRREVLRAVSDFGYGAVEPFDVRTDPAQQREDLDEAGLAVCSVHAKALGADADVLLAGARTVGADTVIVPWMDPERFADKETIQALARELNEGAAKAARPRTGLAIAVRSTPPSSSSPFRKYSAVCTSLCLL